MRTEVSVYNEATGFVITSQGRYGEFDDLSSTSNDWQQALADGLILPVQLVQDDGFAVRVVVDEPLTEDEEVNWVDRWAARLVIPDGMLTITGGSEYLIGEEMDEYTEHIPVPPGEYRAEFYTYLPGVNGWYVSAAVPEDADAFGGGLEPLGTYCRRTRPGEPFPWWLQAECWEDPETDPGHEDEWEDDSDWDDEGPGYTDFLLRLTPIARLSPDERPLPALPPLEEGRGWIPIAVNPRKPALCPVGLLSLDQDGAEAKEEDGDED
jgi:hypothetical protein